MSKMFINIGTKSGKAVKKFLEEDDRVPLFGKRIGDVITGDLIGVGADWKFKITGGTDQDGFPMRYDVEGVERQKLLLASGPGFRPLQKYYSKKGSEKKVKYKRAKGYRRRKRVRGNTVAEDIAQLNLVVVEEGKEPLE